MRIANREDYSLVVQTGYGGVMRPQRFLFVIRSYAPDQVGGGAKSVRNLAEGLKARGHDVHVVRLVPRGQEKIYRDAAVTAGVTGPDKPILHFLPIRNIYWPYDGRKRNPLAKMLWHFLDLNNRRAAADFADLVKSLRPDVVNTSIIDGFSTAIFGAAKASGAKLIHTMRDYYLICTRSGMFRNGRNCEALCVSCRVTTQVRRKDVSNVDLVLANSGFVAARHEREHIFPKTVRCLTQWNANERPIAIAPRVLAADHVIFGFIGRLAPSKGLESLLAATQQLSEKSGRSWALRIAGVGEVGYVEHLKQFYGKDTRIDFVGWSDAETFYSGIDVAVCPSTYNEPLPRVIYEAYGFGLPVIAADTGGIPEIVVHGQEGLLYAGGNVEQLAECLRAFIEMPSDAYKRHSAAALATGRQFVADTVIDTYEARVEALLSGRQPQ